MPDPAEQLTLRGFKLRYIRLAKRLGAIAGFVGVLIILAWVVQYAFTQASGSRNWHHSRFGKSQVQLRGSYMALVVYQHDEPVLWGTSSQIQDVLERENFISSEMLQSPLGEPGEQNYFMIPTVTFASSERPVVYAYPPIGGGASIVYENGNAEFVTEPRYSEIINTITLPDGRPYRPHLGDKLPDPPPDLNVIDLREQP